MGKKAKIIIGVILGVVFVFIGIPLILSFFAPGAIPANADTITGVSQFFVLRDGNLYNARFSLVDSNSAIVTSDASVKFVVTYGHDRVGPFNASQPIEQATFKPHEIYRQEFNIKSTDFQTYQLVLTGAPVVAYAWQIDANNSLPPEYT